MNKIKVALVDDELTGRNLIKGLLEKSEGYELTADFQSGKSALDWLRKNSVDILLCDMKMPEMDGIELMQNIHIIADGLPVLVISGFDDFNYVRGSLVNEAADYLLKSELTEETLTAALDRIRDRYGIVPKGGGLCRRRGYCIQDAAAFTAAHIRRLTERQEIEFTCTSVVPIAISPDFKLLSGVHFAQYKNDICRALQDMIAQIIGDQYPYLIHITKKSHLLLLISFARTNSTLFIINALHNLAIRLQRQSARMLDVTLTVISGSIHQTLEQAVEETGTLEELLEDKLYLGGNRVVSAASAQKLSYTVEDLPQGLRNQLEFELENHISGASETLGDILEVMERERYSLSQVYKTCRWLAHLMEKQGVLAEQEKHEVILRLQGYEEYEQFRSEMLELYHRKMHALQSAAAAEYSPRIAQVIDYVEKNFTSDITLEDCAKLVGSSYHYLSKEFKRETGMRFVEYLNRQRVSRAKSLLIRNTEPMRRIAELSGFRNYNYFFKVFREIEGMSPSEFMAKK